MYSSKDVETVTLTCFCVFVADFGQVIVCLVIYFFEISCVLRVIFLPIQILYVFHKPFLSFESNSLSLTAIVISVKEYLDQSQDCGNLVLIKVKPNLWIIVYFYCFYGHEFILWLSSYSNSKLVCCLRPVWTGSCRCQRLIQNPRIYCDKSRRPTVSYYNKESHLKDWFGPGSTCSFKVVL